MNLEDTDAIDGKQMVTARQRQQLEKEGCAAGALGLFFVFSLHRALDPDSFGDVPKHLRYSAITRWRR